MRIGGTGLRGVRDLDMECRYPLTVISGRNGTGKSTLLALAALAFHRSSGHLPMDALRKPKAGEDSTYYTFGDFFFRGPGDAAAAGVKWAWRYEDEGGVRTIEMRRSSDKKWMSYDRRPSRPVHFIGIARTVPAIERRVLRHHFPIASTAETDVSLDAVFRPRLDQLMGRTYTDAAVMQTRGHALRRVSADVSYSSFNMGAGEDLLVELLYRLQAAPVGALVVIEEIELGLHPAAVRKLAQIVQEIALRKSLQLIVSTHSFDFLDQVPRIARMLIQRGADEHVITYEPTARYAMGDMAGTWNPELIVACEDDFAASILRLALSGTTTRRTKVIPVGSADSLRQFAKYHLVVGAPERVLLVWDGDVTDNRIIEMAGSFEAEANINWTRMPGDSAPERWAHTVIEGPDATMLLAERFKESPEYISRCLAECAVLPDPHGLVFELALALGRPVEDVAAAVLDAIRQVAAGELDLLGRQVDAVLDGRPNRLPVLPPVAV
jgi:energy-coupling factor transporter ATP-binding protein EcfA2